LEERKSCKTATEEKIEITFPIWVTFMHGSSFPALWPAKVPGLEKRLVALTHRGLHSAELAQDPVFFFLVLGGLRISFR
jgi:hypothetical protein